MDFEAANIFGDIEEEVELDGEPLSIEEELDRFRQQWRQELSSDYGRSTNETGSKQGQIPAEASIEDEAKFLFLQGVKSEQSGRLYDAIRYYRRAVQLVPDIEFRVDYKQTSRVRTVSETSVESNGGTEAEEDDDQDIDRLLRRFQRLRTDNDVCKPLTEQSKMHISNLPSEVLNYICRWVVSSDFDIHSLENLALVSRGFYVCARDEDVWRLICQKVWGYNLGSLKTYGTWRAMYIERPHLRFNGCYISKMSYMRQGERGLDNFYKPFHFVEYYRYIRFFPEGQMLMLTTADAPQITVGKLHHHGAKMQGILHGYYKMAGDHVTCVLKRRKVVDYLTNTYSYYRQKKRRERIQNEAGEQVFNAEFTVKKVGRRPHALLTWSHYTVRTVYKSTGHENVADFELNNQSYPPMNFSRVKSYTAVADAPLE